MQVPELTELINEHMRFTRSRSTPAMAGEESWAGSSCEQPIEDYVENTTMLAISWYPSRGWSNKKEREEG